MTYVDLFGTLKEKLARGERRYEEQGTVVIPLTINEMRWITREIETLRGEVRDAQVAEDEDAAARRPPPPAAARRPQVGESSHSGERPIGTPGGPPQVVSTSNARGTWEHML